MKKRKLGSRGPVVSAIGLQDSAYAPGLPLNSLGSPGNR
jgi:hypothetical protein